MPHPALLLFLCALLMLPGCRKPPPPPMETFEVMGTTAVVSGQKYRIKKQMERLNDLLSIYSLESEITAVNQVAGTSRIPVSKDTYRVLDLAVEYYKKTEGAFDVTAAPISQLWGFGGSALPDNALSPSVLKAASQGMGSDKILLENRTVLLDSPYTQVDLGGIAIGYAVDISLLDLRNSGTRNLMIRLGNSARVLGKAHGGEPWTFPIPDPFREEAVLGDLVLHHNQGMSISEIGDKTVEIKGKQHGHIIDPRTGLPVEGTALAVVFSTTATMSDAVSTALFVVGAEKAGYLLRRFPKCEALVVPDRQPLELWMTRGFAEQFTVPPEHQSAIRLFEKEAAPIETEEIPEEDEDPDIAI